MTEVFPVMVLVALFVNVAVLNVVIYRLVGVVREVLARQRAVMRVEE